MDEGGSIVVGFGGNNDCPPIPTTSKTINLILNNNYAIFICKTPFSTTENRKIHLQETVTSQLLRCLFTPIHLLLGLLLLTNGSKSPPASMAVSRSGVSKPRFVFVFVFLLLERRITVGAVTVNDIDGGRSGVCAMDLSSFLPFPYSNMSNMICKPIWNTFVLRYSQSDDHVMTIVLSALYTTGWVGIGFSKDGLMVGSSAMVGWVTKEGRARIRQYFLQGVTISEVIPYKGELPLTNIPATVVLHEATIYLVFQLKFSVRLTHQPVLLAYGTANPTHKHLTRHVDKTTIMFDFSAGSASVATEDIGRMKKNHGVLGIFGWGLILPAGAIIARYFKHRDPLWYYLHIVIQFTGFIIGLAGVVLGRALYGKIHANIPTHRGIGFFVLALSILQILAFFLRPKKEAKIRRYWNWYHHWLGRIALFFGALNIVLGIQIGGGNEWKIGYGFLLGILLIAIIILEVLLMMRRSNEKDQPPPAYPMNPI